MRSSESSPPQKKLNVSRKFKIQRIQKCFVPINKCVVTLALCRWANSFGRFGRLWFIYLIILGLL